MRIAAIFVLLAAAACGGTQEPVAEGVCPPGVTIVDAWTKPARPGQPVSAAYVTICNGEETDDALITISNGPAPVAGAIELHQSEMTDGVMSMSRVESILLPAGEKTTFEPGGAHIMLIGVEAAIDDGAEPTLRLEFENAEPVQRAFEVRGDDGAMDHSGH